METLPGPGPHLTAHVATLGDEVLVTLRAYLLDMINKDRLGEATLRMLAATERELAAR